MKTDSAPSSPCPSPAPEVLSTDLAAAEDKEGGRGDGAGDGEIGECAAVAAPSIFSVLPIVL